MSESNDEFRPAAPSTGQVSQLIGALRFPRMLTAAEIELLRNNKKDVIAAVKAKAQQSMVGSSRSFS
jgi:hypothetical protein